jgi:ABC-type polysaccharide/polyol phosphate transport system ATPase subunit
MTRRGSRPRHPGWSDLSKRFRIPLDRSFTLKHRLTHWRSASRYRTLEALLDINFEVPAGEFIGIIGHNGSGKSTLLKILARIYHPDAGRVTIEGKVSPFLELGVGFNPELTARENIFLSGAILGLGREELHRLLRRDHRFRGARAVRRPQAQELLLGHGGAARLLPRHPGSRGDPADGRGARRR